MGIRSFLLRIDNKEQLDKFYAYREYLSNYYANELDEEITIEKIEEFVPSEPYYYMGDFAVELVGFKYWAGAIWALLSTHTAGEEVVYMLNKFLNTYHTRLWNIPSHKIKYDEEPSYYTESKAEAYDIFNMLISKVELIDYAPYIKNKLECIEFDKKRLIKAFHIESIV